MRKSTEDDAWIEELDMSELLKLLLAKGLSIRGSDCILRARLRQHLRFERNETTMSGTPSSQNMEDRTELHVDAGEPQSPHSPNTIAEPWVEQTTPPSHQWPLLHSAPEFARTSASYAQVIMTKWQLNFSGARGENAKAFLKRIEDGRLLNPISDVELLCCLPTFLSGIAQAWYEAHRAEWETYENFKIEWRERFKKPNFQFAVLHQAVTRSQGEDESVADYLTCVQAIFARLQPPWPLAQ